MTVFTMNLKPFCSRPRSRSRSSRYEFVSRETSGSESESGFGHPSQTYYKSITFSLRICSWAALAATGPYSTIRAPLTNLLQIHHFLFKNLLLGRPWQTLTEKSRMVRGAPPKSARRSPRGPPVYNWALVWHSFCL